MPSGYTEKTAFLNIVDKGEEKTRLGVISKRTNEFIMPSTSQRPSIVGGRRAISARSREKKGGMKRYIFLAERQRRVDPYAWPEGEKN